MKDHPLGRWDARIRRRVHKSGLVVRETEIHSTDPISQLLDLAASHLFETPANETAVHLSRDAGRRVLDVGAVPRELGACCAIPLTGTASTSRDLGQDVSHVEIDHAQVGVFGIAGGHRPRSTRQIRILRDELELSVVGTGPHGGDDVEGRFLDRTVRSIQ